MDPMGYILVTYLSIYIEIFGEMDALTILKLKLESYNGRLH